MLNPQILLGDKLEYTATNMFRHIQSTFLDKNSSSSNLNRSPELYSLLALQSPFLYSLNSLPISRNSAVTKDSLATDMIALISEVLNDDGSFTLKVLKTKLNKLFSSSLCLLNLMAIYDGNLNNCYNFLQNGLFFLDKKLNGLSPKIGKYRVDESLAAYTLLQASIVLKDKKYTLSGSRYFNAILVSDSTIGLGKSGLLPNSIDEYLLTRILYDLYDLSGKEKFLIQAINLSKISFFQQKKILDSFQNSGFGSFFKSSVDLTVLALSCYNWLRQYRITKDEEILELSSYTMRFISEVVDQSLTNNVLFPSWIKPQSYEVSGESSPLGARFYLDAIILGKEYFPESIIQTAPKKIVPLLRVRA